MSKSTDHDRVLLHSLTSDWSSIPSTMSLSMRIAVKNLREDGLAEFSDGRARRTPKGIKHMRKSRCKAAAFALDTFQVGVREVVAGEHVPTFGELAAGYTILDPKRSKRSDQSRAGQPHLKSGRVFAGEHNITDSAYIASVADYYAGCSLTNQRTILARVKASA